MKDIIEKALQAVELARASGKIKKGTNETTKALERGTAKLVVIAEDVSPAEITMHLPLLAQEKKVICVAVPKKEDLGTACGLGIGAVSVAVTDPGDSMPLIKELLDDYKNNAEKVASEKAAANAKQADENKAAEKEVVAEEKEKSATKETDKQQQQPSSGEKASDAEQTKKQAKEKLNNTKDKTKEAPDESNNAADEGKPEAAEEQKQTA